MTSQTRWRIRKVPNDDIQQLGRELGHHMPEYVGYRPDHLHVFYGDTIGDVMDMIHLTEPTA